MLQRPAATLLLAVPLLACASTPASKPDAPEATTAPVSDEAAGAAFEKLRDGFIDAYFAAWPNSATLVGDHTRDGELPELTPEALAEELTRLEAAIIALASAPTSTPQQAYERELLLGQARGMRFWIRDLKMFTRSPLAYVVPFMAGPPLLAFIVHDYAPEKDRAAAMAKACDALPASLDNAQAILPEAMPRTWIQVGMMMSGGMAQMTQNASKAFPSLEAADREKLEASLAKCTSALGGFAKFLEGRMATANDDFRLGEDKYLAAIRDLEGLETTVERLREVGQADLDRNLAALGAAAQQIDPTRPVAEVVKKVLGEKPAPDAMLDLAREQSKQALAFVREKKLATIPADHQAAVELTPPFMRFNFAFLNTPGPLETKALPSYYYITPPNPEWPKAKQQAYLPSKHFLLFVSVHEVWPGHFLHFLHKTQSESRAAKSFCSYAMSEGWAHYVEEMMWDQGFTNDDPKAHIGQLQGALVRNVRFMVSLGLHTGDLTVPEAKKMFMEKAFRDEGNAMQQAARGTFDPMYLNYTLGKLMIKKLRDDWLAQNEGATIGQFHDEFMRYQCAPIPSIRRLMLGEDAGPAL